jgi:hypothetical protein
VQVKTLVKFRTYKIPVMYLEVSNCRDLCIKDALETEKCLPD